MCIFSLILTSWQAPVDGILLHTERRCDAETDVELLGWLVKNWGWLLASLLLAAYFAFYVLAMREQRTGSDGKPRLPCDRC